LIHQKFSKQVDQETNTLNCRKIGYPTDMMIPVVVEGCVVVGASVVVVTTFGAVTKKYH
jgi:hypothetical protein